MDFKGDCKELGMEIFSERDLTIIDNTDSATSREFRNDLTGKVIWLAEKNQFG